MKKNKLLIILGIGLLTLSSCNESNYEGELNEIRLSNEINYLNEFRLNSSLKYQIPLKSSKELSKNDIKEILLDDEKIKSYDLINLDESNYKYYLLLDSKSSYSNLKIKLSNNKIYEYNVNLTNFNNTSYEGECSFKCEEFSVEKGSIDKYKLTYSLKMDKDFGIDVYNNLKMNHPIFNGKASVYNQDKEMYVMVGGGYVNLSKNTSYLINIEFEESGSIYYFDEYLPFRICFDFDFSKARYIFPEIESNYHSLVLDKIF